MPLVMLKRSWPGQFHRTVRDESGQPLRRLDFAPGEPLQLDELEHAACADAIPAALVYCALDEKGRARPVDEPVELSDVVQTERDSARKRAPEKGAKKGGSKPAKKGGSKPPGGDAPAPAGDAPAPPAAE